MKKFIIGLLSVIVLISSSVVYASDTIQAYLFPVKYVINGQIKELNSEYTTLNYNGHAYVPLRFIAESLDAKVNYHKKETAITINTPYQQVPIKYDKNAACRNGDFVYESYIRMELNCNLDAFVAFLSNTTQLQKDWVRIVRYTVEGDPITQQLDFDGEQIIYTIDNTRDKFGGSEKTITQTKYSKITTTKFIYDNVEYTEFFLTGTEPDSEPRKLFNLNSQIVADVGKNLFNDEIITDKEAEFIDDWQFNTGANAYTVQAYLFPATIEFNGVSKEVNNSEYVVLNYQGHAYVPIRFVAENMGILVKYDDSTKTILLNETQLSQKLPLNDAFLSTVAQGKLPGIEFGIGSAKKKVFETWGEPHRTGSRHGRYDAWFDYNYYFSGPNQTVGAIGVSGDTIHYTIDQVKKALGQPNYEGLSLVENGWEMSYAVGAYVLFFSADKKDGTIYYMTFMKQNENTEANNYDFTTWNEKKLYDFFYEILEYTNQISMKIYPTKEEIITKYQAYFTSELSVKIVDSLFVKTNGGWRVPDGDGGYIFTVPVKGEYEQSNVEIDIQEKFIRLKATYDIGMYSFIQYTIQYDSKPIITEWIKTNTVNLTDNEAKDILKLLIPKAVNSYGMFNGTGFFKVDTTKTIPGESRYALVIDDKINTITALKNAVEEVFTHDVAQTMFYSRYLTPEDGRNPLFKDYEGKLYNDTQNGGHGWAFDFLTNTTKVISQKDNIAEVELDRTLFNNPDKKLTLRIEYVNGKWILASLLDN